MIILTPSPPQTNTVRLFWHQLILRWSLSDFKDIMVRWVTSQPDSQGREWLPRFHPGFFNWGGGGHIDTQIYTSDLIIYIHHVVAQRATALFILVARTIFWLSRALDLVDPGVSFVQRSTKRITESKVHIFVFFFFVCGAKRYTYDVALLWPPSTSPHWLASSLW